ncbi:MAG: ABC transporter permease subunit [Ancalomicrobiaceae bacterium]|nr:ABC transporter permease subunit [Ancalomicrobiaceae bacterium]
MKKSSLGAWIAVVIAALYFLMPLVGAAEFSLRMIRGIYSFEAYKVVFSTVFEDTFLFSSVIALLTIAVSVLIVVPTVYFVQLRLRRLRPIVEFITLLPLVIPAIVLVFGYIRLYNSSSWLPLTGSVMATNILLLFAYVALALPYMYRAIDSGMRTVDVRTLTEAAESLGASLPTVIFHIILPNVRSAVLSGAFLTFAIVLGEFTMANLLNRPVFGVYLVDANEHSPYEAAALSLIAFLITWACMGLMQYFGRDRRAAKPGT